MPEELLNRAEAILEHYESEEKITHVKDSENIQLRMDFESKEPKKDELREKLKTIDPLHMTPMEAINTLFELKELE